MRALGAVGENRVPTTVPGKMASQQAKTCRVCSSQVPDLHGRRSACSLAQLQYLAWTFEILCSTSSLAFWPKHEPQMLCLHGSLVGELHPCPPSIGCAGAFRKARHLGCAKHAGQSRVGTWHFTNPCHLFNMTLTQPERGPRHLQEAAVGLPNTQMVRGKHQDPWTVR